MHDDNGSLSPVNSSYLAQIYLDTKLRFVGGTRQVCRSKAATRIGMTIHNYRPPSDMKDYINVNLSMPHF